ncbi:putative RNA-directed DNA polymerase from transposon BS [Trichonephila clavipes]|uniref:Putative RNA-directed DNA polymerase from transposon BS n=1 Tax=Trichonephila clavipes TaxID=2585209 RepID=A0A8X6R5K6_TRICX|nr:putative RNA-directed DNA polymerase from transposon BS [Trichonephila clavipes]
MVECRLGEFLESKGAISDCQAGCRRHRSTTDQVVKLTQAIKDGFHRKQSTLAVLVDFKAAYDKVSLSKYLEINLDSKLHWDTHIAETSEKDLKRLNLLKRLTATKWGATQDVLSPVYKTYVHSVLDYGCEVVTLESTTNLEKYDVVQNSALRIITGGAKSTSMQLQTGIEILESRRDMFTQILGDSQKNRLQVQERVQMCNIETQTSLSHEEFLMKKHQRPLLMTHHAPNAVPLHSRCCSST